MYFETLVSSCLSCPRAICTSLLIPNSNFTNITVFDTVNHNMFNNELNMESITIFGNIYFIQVLFC